MQEIDAHFNHHGLLKIQQVPHLRPAVFRLARLGRIVRVLPGIYATADTAGQPRTRMAALVLKDPDVVFTGMSAAGLLWDAALLPDTVEAAGRLRCSAPGFTVRPRRIKDDWIAEVDGGVRVTNPALTAIDLIPTEGGRFIDHLFREAPRRGADVLDLLWAALHAHPRRSGNQARIELLRQSRALPWSEAERLAHEQLRTAGITGWLTNHPISMTGATHRGDLVFPALRLVVELDGFEFHSSRAAFEKDRAIQNALVLAGWHVLRFTWPVIENGSWLADLRSFIDHHPNREAVLRDAP